MFKSLSLIMLVLAATLPATNACNEIKCGVQVAACGFECGEATPCVLFSSFFFFHTEIHAHFFFFFFFFSIFLDNASVAWQACSVNVVIALDCVITAGLFSRRQQIQRNLSSESKQNIFFKRI